MSVPSLLTFAAWQPQQTQELLQLALTIKTKPDEYTSVLAGKNLVGVFEKPSLRTRLSFDIGINKLGGHFVYVDMAAGKLNGREDTADLAANINCWADGLIARVFSHSSLQTMQTNTDIPVINALCDLYHPCQALADFLTLLENIGDVKGQHIAYIGDGNNVTHSLLIVGALLGCNVTSITPKGYEVDPDIFEHACSLAEQTGAVLNSSHDISDANGAVALYTDTWLSMGDDTPLSAIKETFAPYQINQTMMNQTGAKYVLHCQPAHRDLEITSEVMDSDASLLMQQAENRMHAQNAILTHLFSH